MPAQSLTHEHELTEPVDLCSPNGLVLNPNAKGWSRRPLHTANLRGRWGRNKRWDYWAVLTDELVLTVTYADIDYLGLINIDWIELRSGNKGSCLVPVPGARRISLPDLPGTEALRYRSRRLSIDITDDDDATRLSATWTHRGRPCHLDVSIGARAQDSLNVVIPWSDRRFQFTSKHQARPAVGHLDVGDRRWSFGGADPSGDAVEAWGVLDVGRGRWPYSTRWNWGGGAGRAVDGGPVVGLQFGAKWTDGTGFTENGVILDGTIVKIGEELAWEYDWDNPMRPWRVHGNCGLDVTLEPVYDRHEHASVLVVSTHVHQVFGRWTGEVPDGTGSTVRVEGILGFAEESRSRW